MLKITLWWTSTLSRAAGSRKISSRFMHRISNGQMGHLPRKQSSPYYLPPRRQKDAPLKARVLCPNSHLGNVTAVPWQHLVKPTLALFSCQHQPILSHLKNTKKDTKIHSVYLINSSINPEESLWMRLLSKLPCMFQRQWRKEGIGGRARQTKWTAVLFAAHTIHFIISNQIIWIRQVTATVDLCTNVLVCLRVNSTLRLCYH